MAEKSIVVEIAKVHLSVGSELDLPGLPISLQPLEFSDGLEVGRLVFTSDSGRCFIGHEPSVGNKNYNRTSFPYRNIEVLTENSDKVINQFIDNRLKQSNRTSFYDLALTNTTTWKTTGITVPYGASVHVNYHIKNEFGTLRVGEMVVTTFAQQNEPQIVDNGMVDQSVLDDGSATAAYDQVRFRAVVKNSDGVNKIIVLEYINTASGNAKLYYRLNYV